MTNLFMLWIDDRFGSKDIFFKVLDLNGNVIVNDMKVTENFDVNKFDAGIINNTLYVVYENNGNVILIYIKILRQCQPLLTLLLCYTLLNNRIDKIEIIGTETIPKKSTEVSFIIDIAECTCSFVRMISPSPSL